MTIRLDVVTQHYLNELANLHGVSASEYAALLIANGIARIEAEQPNNPAFVNGLR
jgi:uncharacterized membrane protein